MHLRILSSSLAEGEFLASHSSLFIFLCMGGWVPVTVAAQSKA
jgi:hypothetical protein